MTGTRESRSRGVFQAEVLNNRQLCRGHYALNLGLAEFGPSQPGQFINILCGGDEPPAPVEVDWPEGEMPKFTGGELAARKPLLRRPISLAGRTDKPDGTVELEIIHHVIGVGTAWLAELKVGDAVDLMGPLGAGFTIIDDRPAAAVVGGGVGIPPLLYLAEALAAAGKDVTAFAGARTEALLPLSVNPSEPPSQAGWPTMCTGEFAARGAPTVVASDDGSIGAPGFIHEPFARWLAGRDAAELAVYACGPDPMMKAVAGICAAEGVPCQLALERYMACGIGTCLGCVVKVKDDSPAGWRHELACKDGPVFDARELIWEPV